ncbi:PLP-dependent transferase [Myxococcaceae bacterium GXIMD 01537]
MAHSFDTLAIHAGREDLAALGVHAPPLDLSTTYPLPSLAQGTVGLDAMAAGGTPQGSSIYARLHNPTVARFEDALATLEGAEQAVAFGSGMAALTACLMAAKQRGGHVVALRPLYGGSDHLLASELLGLSVTWATPDTVREALRPDTALVVMETPANPTLAMVDIRQVVEQAGKVPVLVDSTFATPVLQNPLAHGAALVLHSATKFLGGHGDVVAGVVATSAEWAALLRQVRVATGALLHPLAGYLLHRGLQTLPLRVRASQAGAQCLAARLAAHPAVQAVRYPGLPGQDPLGLLGRQLKGPGALLAFELAGGYEAAAAVLGHVKLFTSAVSLGSVDSLIQHPAGLTHRVVDAGAREESGIGAGMLRVSVGLEDPEDLWADLAQALAAASAARPGLRRAS